MKNNPSLALPVNGEGIFPPVYGGNKGGVNLLTALYSQKTELLPYFVVFLRT